MKSSEIKHPSERKEYSRPSITTVMLDGSDIVTVSDPDVNGDDIPSQGARQRDYIFDDL